MVTANATLTESQQARRTRMLQATEELALQGGWDGVQMREVNCADTDEYVNLITISDGQRSIAGTLSGRRAEPRLVAIDGHGLDMPPSAHMVVISNDDRPGVIGLVGTTMGEHGVNIADMDVGRTPGSGSAVMVLATDVEPPAAAVDKIRQAPGITSVAVLRG